MNVPGDSGAPGDDRKRGCIGGCAQPARRRVLVAVAGFAALPLANGALAQAPGQSPTVGTSPGTTPGMTPGIPSAPLPPLDPNVQAFARGREVRVGRVQVALPLLADNGNSVSLKVSVESPMTATDHVKAIALVSSRNPEPNMARFFLGPRAGRAEVSTRVRLAGSQRVMAVAEMSDGTFWVGSRDIVVTHSACVDES